MTCLYALPQGCCEQTGPWDFYHEYGSSDTAGTPYIPRTASIYLDPPNNPDTSYEATPDWSVEIPNSGKGRSFQSKIVASSTAALGVTDADHVYLYCSDSGTHYATKHFQFTADAEDLADAANHANVTFAHDATNDCVKFTTTTLSGASATEYARHTTAIPWTRMGVISGEAVSHCKLLGLRYKLLTASDKLTSHTLQIRLVNPSSHAADVLSGDLLATLTLPTTAGDWVTVGEQTLRTVNSGPPDYTSSAATFDVELRYDITRATLTGGEADEVLLLDDIRIETVHSGNSLVGLIKIDAITKTYKWAVTAGDWLALADPPNDGEMGPITMGVYEFPSSGTEMGTLTVWPLFADTTLVYSGGVRRIQANGYLLWEVWEIDGNGGFTYQEKDTSDLSGIGVWIDSVYTYYARHGYFNPPYYDDDRFGLNTDYMPVACARQSNRALGLYLPEAHDAPLSYADYDDWPGWHSIETVEVYLGEFDLNGDDPLDRPRVANASKIYEAQSVEYGWTSGIASTTVQVTDFDAAPAAYIAVIAKEEITDVEEVTIDSLTRKYPEQVTGTSALVLGGSGGQVVEEMTVFVVDDTYNGTPTYSTDESAFYPRWRSVRALHTSESAVGGGNRVAVFQRVPLDQNEADDDYYGSTAIAEWKLRVWRVASGTPSEAAGNFPARTRHGRTSQPTGTVQFGTPPVNIPLTAIQGSDADYDVDGSGELDLTVNLHQVAVGEAERTVYTTGTAADGVGTLDVYLDIAGGHDTVGDLRDLIREGGDFTCGASADTTPVADAETDTVTLTGGSTSASTTAANYIPSIHDSSSRYLYLMNFPYRVYDTGPTDVSGRNRRRACLVGGAGGTNYANRWLVSHDGETWNPEGEHTDRWARGHNITMSPTIVGDQDFASVKNCNAVELCPELGEI